MKLWLTILIYVYIKYGQINRGVNYPLSKTLWSDLEVDRYNQALSDLKELNNDEVSVERIINIVQKTMMKEKIRNNPNMREHPNSEYCSCGICLMSSLIATEILKELK